MVGYGFDAEFEKVLAAYCARSRPFWGRIGRAVDPAQLADPVARRLIEACAAIASDTGAGPGSTVIAVQRLRRWQADGKLDKASVLAVLDLLEDVEDNGLPDEDAVSAEAAPILQRHAQQEALKGALAQFGQKGDLAPALSALAAASRIGVADTSLGTTLGAPAFAAIAAANRTQRLPTGISELDVELEGGLPRGSLGLIAAGTGGGKSMALNHIAAWALAEGRFVCFATLELSEARALARLKAALLSVPITDLLEGRDRVAQRRFGKVANKLGVCFTRYFTPGMTTVQDVETWVKDCERQVNARCEVIVVDYADKMSAAGRKADDNDYKAMGTVYEGLRILAEQRDAWCWTASQPQRGSRGNKFIDTDDLADSQHKARVTDLLITANRRELEGTVSLEWFVAKNREGRSRGHVGPLPQDWVHGRASLDAPFLWRSGE